MSCFSCFYYFSITSTNMQISSAFIHTGGGERWEFTLNEENRQILLIKVLVDSTLLFEFDETCLLTFKNEYVIYLMYTFRILRPKRFTKLRAGCGLCWCCCCCCLLHMNITQFTVLAILQKCSIECQYYKCLRCVLSPHSRQMWYRRLRRGGQEQTTPFNCTPFASLITFLAY